MNLIKKFLVSIIGIGIILTSCQSDELFTTDECGEKQVIFILNVPGDLGTRAGQSDNDSDKGGFTNDQGTLSYTLVLTANNDCQVLKATGEDKQVVFTPTVVLGRNYKVTAYAHFEDALNDLTTIPVNKGINDESKDAYTWTGDINFATDGTEKQISLTRPYAKLRLVATDYNQAKTDVKEITVTYENPVFTEFNAVSGEFVNTDRKTYTKIWDKEYYEKTITIGEKTIFADYIPVNANGDYSFPFTITVTYNSGESFSREFDYDIPVKRNALTTLKGNFFTANAEINVEVEEDFDIENTILFDKWDGSIEEMIPVDGVYTITKASQLAWVAKEVNNENTFKNKTILLANDIDLNNIEWTPIGNDETYFCVFQGTFDGQGRTISNLMISEKKNKLCGLFGEVDGANIKNLTISNASISVEANYVGVLVGRTDLNGTINNCHIVNSTISGNDYVGTLVGSAFFNLVVENSTVDKNTIVLGNETVGGIVGMVYDSDVIINNCKSSADVKGNKYIGGIAGRVNYAKQIANCHVDSCNISGDVSLGGISGTAYLTIVENCEVGNNVNISGSEYIGGICGISCGSIIECCISGSNINGDRAVGGISGLLGEFTNKNGLIVGCASTSDARITANSTFGVINGSTLNNNYIYGSWAVSNEISLIDGSNSSNTEIVGSKIFGGVLEITQADVDEMNEAIDQYNALELDTKCDKKWLYVEGSQPILVTAPTN